MKKNAYQEEGVFFAIGLVFVGIGIICNEWVFAKALSPDGILERITRTKIWIFDTVFILMGLSLIIYRKSTKPKEVLLQFIRTYPRTAALSIGIFFTITLLLCLEGVFFILNNYQRARISYEVSRTEGLRQVDELANDRPGPYTKVSVAMKANDKIIYDVVYLTDKCERRITPVENPASKSNFILFFGGSHTFGEGVNDNQTMPFYVSRAAPGYMPYNYGLRGGGPQEMLARLQSPEITREINEKEGILIYNFLDGHIQRAIGSMYVTANWGENMPHYTVNGSGKLIRKGDFTTGRPLISFLYRILGKSQIIKYFGSDFPPCITKAHLRLTCKIIEESCNIFREKFNSDDFYLLFYPGSKYPYRIIPYLKKAGIKYLDYSNLFDATKKEFIISEFDKHPSPQAYQTVAARLIEDIPKLKTASGD